jgi:hypothetical protein
MGSSRRHLVLAILVAVVAAAAYALWSSSPAGTPTTASSGPGPSRTPAGSGVGVPDVRLDALKAGHPEPDPVDRNLFRFGQPPAPAAVPRPATPTPPVVATPVARAIPSKPPIPLKFIGFWEEPATNQRVAALRDDRGVYHGSEGDTIEGRYKILRIGPESIDLSYLDGTGRQTIRLSGS